MANGHVRGDFKALDAFVKGMTGPKMVVKLGVFGNKNTRDEGGGTTNAEIGLVHELGSRSRNIPSRSFLRMPLHQRQTEIVAETKVGAEKKLAEGNVVGVLNTLGASCHNAVQDAFGSQGFGTWPDDKEATKARKGKDPAVLIDSGQLRRSIAWKVEKNV